MVTNYIPQRGDIIWLDFNPQAGHEQAGKRPALVLSPKEYNQKRIDIFPELIKKAGQVRSNSSMVSLARPIGGGAEKIVSELGRELVLASGGSVLGHPMGPTEGAKSMMQAAKALGEGVTLAEAANQKGNEALKVSIEKWKT